MFYDGGTVGKWGENGGGGKLGGGEFEGASTIFGFWKILGGIYRFLSKNRADGWGYP